MVLAVVLTAVLEVLDSTIVNVALPHMKAAFGITSDQTTWILTSYVVASVVVMPPTGLLARRWGRRRLILTAITGFAGFSMLCGLSRSIAMIVAARIGQGLFGAFLIPLSQSILFDSFPKERRGQAMALFGLGVVVAPVLGPTLGALLTESFSWRAVFYVNLPIAAFAMMMMGGEFQADEVKPVAVDWTGLALMVAAIAGLQLVLDLGPTRDWFQSHLIQVAAAVCLAAGTAFVWRGLRVPGNIIDFALFRDRSFAAANVAMVGFGLAMFGTIAVLPLFTQGLLGYSVTQAGMLFIPRGLAAGFGMVVTGAVLVPRADARVLVGTGLLLTGLGNLAMSGLDLDAGWWGLALPGVVSGLGMGLFFVPMSTVAFQNVGPDKQDEASGLYGVIRSLGSSAGISIVGWQLASRIQFHWGRLSDGLTPWSPAVTAYLRAHQLQAGSVAAASALASDVARQAQVLAFGDAFRLTGCAALLMIPMVLVMRAPPRGRAAPAGH